MQRTATHELDAYLSQFSTSKLPRTSAQQHPPDHQHDESIPRAPLFDRPSTYSTPMHPVQRPSTGFRPTIVRDAHLQFEQPQHDSYEEPLVHSASEPRRENVNPLHRQFVLESAKRPRKPGPAPSVSFSSTAGILGQNIPYPAVAQLPLQPPTRSADPVLYDSIPGPHINRSLYVHSTVPPPHQDPSRNISPQPMHGLSGPGAFATPSMFPAQFQPSMPFPGAYQPQQLPLQQPFQQPAVPYQVAPAMTFASPFLAQYAPPPAHVGQPAFVQPFTQSPNWPASFAPAPVPVASLSAPPPTTASVPMPAELSQQPRRGATDDTSSVASCAISVVSNTDLLAGTRFAPIPSAQAPMPSQAPSKPPSVTAVPAPAPIAVAPTRPWISPELETLIAQRLARRIVRTSGAEQEQVRVPLSPAGSVASSISAVSSSLPSTVGPPLLAAAAGHGKRHSHSPRGKNRAWSSSSSEASLSTASSGMSTPTAPSTPRSITNSELGGGRRIARSKKQRKSKVEKRSGRQPVNLSPFAVSSVASRMPLAAHGPEKLESRPNPSSGTPRRSEARPVSRRRSLAEDLEADAESYTAARRQRSRSKSLTRKQQSKPSRAKSQPAPVTNRSASLSPHTVAAMLMRPRVARTHVDAQPIALLPPRGSSLSAIIQNIPFPVTVGSSTPSKHARTSRLPLAASASEEDNSDSASELPPRHASRVRHGEDAESELNSSIAVSSIHSAMNVRTVRSAPFSANVTGPTVNHATQPTATQDPLRHSGGNRAQSMSATLEALLKSTAEPLSTRRPELDFKSGAPPRAASFSAEALLTTRPVELEFQRISSANRARGASRLETTRGDPAAVTTTPRPTIVPGLSVPPRSTPSSRPASAQRSPLELATPEPSQLRLARRLASDSESESGTSEAREAEYKELAPAAALSSSQAVQAPSAKKSPNDSISLRFDTASHLSRRSVAGSPETAAVLKTGPSPKPSVTSKQAASATDAVQPTPQIPSARSLQSPEPHKQSLVDSHAGIAAGMPPVRPVPASPAATLAPVSPGFTAGPKPSEDRSDRVDTPRSALRRMVEGSISALPPAGADFEEKKSTVDAHHVASSVAARTAGASETALPRPHKSPVSTRTTTETALAPVDNPVTVPPTSPVMVRASPVKQSSAAAPSASPIKSSGATAPLGVSKSPARSSQVPVATAAAKPTTEPRPSPVEFLRKFPLSIMPTAATSGPSVTVTRSSPLRVSSALAREVGVSSDARPTTESPELASAIAAIRTVAATSPNRERAAAERARTPADKPSGFQSSPSAFRLQSHGVQSPTPIERTRATATDTDDTASDSGSAGVIARTLSLIDSFRTAGPARASSRTTRERATLAPSARQVAADSAGPQWGLDWAAIERQVDAELASSKPRSTAPAVRVPMNPTTGPAAKRTDPKEPRTDRSDSDESLYC